MAPARARQPVGGHHPRQLAPGTAQGGLDLQIRQADRGGCAARLVGARHGAPAGHAAVALPARQADHADRRRPIRNHATLRSDERGERFRARPPDRRMVGSDFDGAIIFDESHAMQNAGGGKGERGDVAASQQGRAGLRLNTPSRTPESSMSRRPARRPFTISLMRSASACGAARISPSPPVPNSSRRSRLAASRRWSAGPRPAFARPLHRPSLSYDGVEYELVEHALTEEQRCIYDAYAGAFAIIHNHLDAAMQAANITGSDGTLNGRPSQPPVRPSRAPSSASSAIS